MKESIKIIVANIDAHGAEKELEIIYEEDTLTFVLEGQLFSDDWTATFKPAFERALELWPVA